MKKLIVFLLTFLLMLSFAGCGESSTGSGDESKVTTTTVPSKRELSAEQFKSAVSAIDSMSFEFKDTQTEKELEKFMYSGLKSCTIVHYDGEDVALFMVFDTEENATAVLTDTKAENKAGFDSEIGKNFESMLSEDSVIERVGKSLLVISCNDSEISRMILNATEY